MPDYMYLLESRLSPEQRAALERVQELSRSQEINVYLSGSAIRDLISGQPIRDLDFTVEGNPVRMVRELEKGGARVVWENEKLRHYEMIFAGDADGSISSARDDVYDRPGAKPEIRFAGITEDLRRRDFSFNAIAISLNAQSRGLLLDPTNGLADLERQEVRALSIHAFTNQPVRLMSILRYCARMGSKMETRTRGMVRTGDGAPPLRKHRGRRRRPRSSRTRARRKSDRDSQAMGIARPAGLNPSEAAEAQARLRQPEQACSRSDAIFSPLESVRACRSRSPATCSAG